MVSLSIHSSIDDIRFTPTMPGEKMATAIVAWALDPEILVNYDN